MIDRKTFFDLVRAEPFGGFLSGSQVAGVSNILSEAERRGVGDPRHLAYRLATVFHETGKAMIPVREAGGEAYLKAKPYYPWVGMGLVQVTWEKNAKKFGAIKPEDLMGWPVALRALFDGMDDGVFTGLGLPHFFDAHTDDPVGARRIINGLDRASLVAGYHAKFLAAIKAALSASPALIASQNPVSPTPELDLIRGAVAKAAAEQAKPLAIAPVPVSASVPTAGPRHADNAKAPPLTGWRAVLASVRAHFGQAT